MTFIYGCICMSNFHRGLKNLHQDPTNQTSLLSHISSTKSRESKGDSEKGQSQQYSAMVIE